MNKIFYNKIALIVIICMLFISAPAFGEISPYNSNHSTEKGVSSFLLLKMKKYNQDLTKENVSIDKEQNSNNNQKNVLHDFSKNFKSDSSGYFEQEGIASWYGEKFNGKVTASGECFNMEDITAAHKYLPFGTIVEVYSLLNGTSVTVRINDRGPFIPGRIINLSYAAAEKINFINDGIVKVKIKVIDIDN